MKDVDYRLNVRHRDDEVTVTFTFFKPIEAKNFFDDLSKQMDGRDTIVLTIDMKEKVRDASPSKRP